MKNAHERVQSFGVIVSLILALTSLILQCAPKPENLVIDTSRVISTNEPMEIRQTAPLPRGNRTLVGPIYWRITINNRADRAASVTDVQALIRDNRHGTYQVSGAFGGVYQDDLTTNALPLNIPAYESRSLVLKGYLPGWVDLPTQAACLRPRISLSNFQRCAFRSGRDLFGNQLEVLRRGDEFLGVSWPVDAYQPEFLLRFRSGGDQLLETTASLLPLM